jgi:hypothetical protein
MKRLPVLIFILLSIVFLGITIPVFVLNPSLYTVNIGSSTSYHTNPEVLWVYSGEKSDDVSALMQELLDAPEPIVLNLKVKDFEEAKRALNEYKEKSQYFNRVIVNLYLTNSTIGDLQRENRKNIADLEQIINNSVLFDQIQRLEIQYQSEDNPAMLYSIIYQGKGIQNALEKSTKAYLDREPSIIAIGNQLALNTTNYQESGELLQDVLTTDRAEQESRNLNQPPLNISSISLAVTPFTGHYGDTLQVTGAYSFMLLPEVTLLIDNNYWKSVVPDQHGIFSSPLMIETLQPGDHIIIANSTNRYSNIAAFNVVSIDPNLTLTATPRNYGNSVTIHGSLDANMQPVTDVPVMILVDEFEIMTVDTDEKGYYNAEVLLSPGNHTIQSSFDDPARPLNPTVSESLLITVSSPGRSLVSILAGTGIVLFSIFISTWYLRRSRRMFATETSESPAAEMFTPAGETIEKTKILEDILSRYKTLFKSKEWSEAARLLYSSMIKRIDFLQVIPEPETMTPREIFIPLSRLLHEAPLWSFITRYEEIRYGGFPLVEQDLLLSAWTEIISNISEDADA